MDCSSWLLYLGFPRQRKQNRLPFLFRIFLTQLNPHLLLCRWILYHWSTEKSYPSLNSDFKPMFVYLLSHIFKKCWDQKTQFTFFENKKVIFEGFVIFSSYNESLENLGKWMASIYPFKSFITTLQRRNMPFLAINPSLRIQLVCNWGDGSLRCELQCVSKTHSFHYINIISLSVFTYLVSYSFSCPVVWPSWKIAYKLNS